jgi:hypothetical protein
MNKVETLIAFAKMFEPIHQQILKQGAVEVSEYDDIWHYYFRQIRPIIEKDLP